MAIVAQNQFYNNFRVLHGISEVPKSQADIGWFLYDLTLNPEKNRYNLVLERTIYVTFSEVMQRFSTLIVGEMNDFKTLLEAKLRKKQERV
jgi:hypothetical protein